MSNTYNNLKNVKCKFKCFDVNSVCFDNNVENLYCDLIKSYIENIEKFLLTHNPPKTYKNNLLEIKDFFRKITDIDIYKKLIITGEISRSNYIIYNKLNIFFEKLSELGAIKYFYNMFKMLPCNNNDVKIGFYGNDNENPDFYLITNRKEKTHFEVTTNPKVSLKKSQMFKWKNKYPNDLVFLVTPLYKLNIDHFHYDLNIDLYSFAMEREPEKFLNKFNYFIPLKKSMIPFCKIPKKPQNLIANFESIFGK